MGRLGYDFFHRDCPKVAQELVGKILVHQTPEGERRLRITETECYCGEGDGAFQTVLGVFFSIPTPFCLLHGAHRLVSGRPPRKSRPCRYV